jgi:hypothetical protein
LLTTSVKNRIADDLGQESFRLQQQAQSFAHVSLVIGDKDSSWFRIRCRSYHLLVR